MVEEAARERASGGVNGAADAALELWRGAPLADVASEPFAGPEIGRLEELHLRALELAIDADLAAGRHAEAIARLEALIAEEPCESACAEPMTCPACGRRYVLLMSHYFPDLALSGAGLPLVVPASLLNSS